MWVGLFQSSAAPKSGCNPYAFGLYLYYDLVSILSRPEERL